MRPNTDRTPTELRPNTDQTPTKPRPNPNETRFEERKTQRENAGNAPQKIGKRTAKNREMHCGKAEDRPETHPLHPNTGRRHTEPSRNHIRIALKASRKMPQTHRKIMESKPILRAGIPNKSEFFQFEQ